MKLNIIKSIVFGFAVSAGTSVMARSNDRFDRRFTEREFDRSLAAEGIIFCVNDDHEATGSCNLRFFDSNSGRTIHVQSQELRDAHCSEHKDLKVALSGSYTIKSIFGDYAKIDDFEVLAQVPEGAQTQKAPNQQSENQVRLGRDI